MYGCIRISRHLIIFNIINVILIVLNIALWSHQPKIIPESTTADPESEVSSDNLDMGISDERQLSNGNDYEEELQFNSLSSWLKRSKDSSKLAQRLPPSKEFKQGITKRNLTDLSLKKYAFKKHGNARKTEVDPYLAYEIPKIDYTPLVNCEALLKGDTRELERAEKVMMTTPKVPIYEETYLSWTRDCEEFKRRRGYVQMPLSREEEEYPLAFSITMFSDVEQVERLLRAIYQPQNFYCIHIDTKSSLLIHETINSITKCFDNVWVATHLDKIKWGDITVILLDVNCMRDLVKYYRGRYKYFINLTGQEFPLRTNLELVRIARIFNGSNDIAGSPTRMDMDRVNYRWKHRWSKTYQQTIYYMTQEVHRPYDVNLTFFKGELHGLFSQRMTEFIVESEHGRKYLDWCSDTGHPSEHYYNTLNYNVHLNAPGGYIGPLDIADNYSTLPVIRVKNWVGLYKPLLDCFGQVVRGICIYSVKDAVWLAKRPELFANKFRLTYQYLAIDCLEERHRNRTMLRNQIKFNSSYYRSLPTVLYGRKDGIT